MIKLSAENVEAIFDRSATTRGNPIEGILTSVPMDVKPEDFDKINELLNQLPKEFHAQTGGGWSFLNACTNRDGEQWTGLHSTMEKLVILGIAIGRVEYVIPRDMWSLLPGSVPYFVVKTIEKLKVTRDGDATPQTVSVDGVLKWRQWSQHEVDAIKKVAAGELHRFSTRDEKGTFCDLEPADPKRAI